MHNLCQDHLSTKNLSTPGLQMEHSDVRYTPCKESEELEGGTLRFRVHTCRTKSSNYSNPFSTGINTWQKSGLLTNKQSQSSLQPPLVYTTLVIPISDAIRSTPKSHNHKLLSRNWATSHPVSFVVHAARLPELSLQGSDLLLELVSLVFTLHSLLLDAQRQM